MASHASPSPTCHQAIRARPGVSDRARRRSSRSVTANTTNARATALNTKVIRNAGRPCVGMPRTA